MDLKLVITVWLIFAASIIYWDVTRWNDDSTILSPCHNAEIKMIHDRPMCTECKLYCDIKPDESL